MARRGSNFWESFNEGTQAVNGVINLYRDSKQRADIKDAYAEDQVDSSQYNPEDFTDSAEKAGGTWSEADQAFKMPNGELQVATNTPTWDAATNSYQGSEGQSLKPRAQFSLGKTTQAERFTPDQISDYRNNRVADIYAESGDVDKAMGVRASAQSLKLGKVQLEQAEMLAKEAKFERNVLKLETEWRMGNVSGEEFVAKAIDLADNGGTPGETFAYKKVEGQTNKYEITRFVNNKVMGSKVGDPEEILKVLSEYGTPNLRKMAIEQENKNRDFKQSRDQFDTNVGLKRDEMKQSEANFQQKMDYQMVSDNEKRELDLQDMGIKNKVANAQVGYYGSRENGGGLNAAQSYALEQQQKFDGARNEIMTALEQGKMTEVEASKRLGMLGMKYGSPGRSLQEPRENTKLQEARIKYITDNPDATASQIENFEIKIGLRPANSYGPPAIKKPGSLQSVATPKRVLSLREQMQTWAPEDIESNMARTINATTEDLEYAQQLQAAYGAARQLNR